jgi:hypothetical protein
MHSGDLSQLPNPFAPEPRSWNRSAMISALKTFLVIAVAFAILMAVTSRGPTWLANRLGEDFSSLDSTEKQSRLDQLSQLGIAGFEPMLAGVADKDPEVVDHAIKLIRDLQTQWTSLPKAESQDRQLALINAIEQYTPRFAEPQQAWAASFLNETIIENADDSSRRSQQVFVAANHALQQLTRRDLVVFEQNVALKPAPHPRDSLGAAKSPQHAEPLPLRVSTVVTVAHEFKVAGASLSIPTVGDAQAAAYAESPDANVDTTQRIDEIAETTTPTRRLVDWTTFDTASIMRVLGSDQATIRDQAAQQLRQRGFSETELSVADAIANSDAAYRLELIRQLVTQDTVDARPWLLLLLRDEDREVKLEAVSALGRFLDPQIRKELRLRMIDETDQKVALRIRNVLQLSCLP